MTASKRISQSCILGLGALLAHVIAAPKTGDVSLRMDDDASQGIRFKLDPIPDDYFSKPIRLIPIDDSLSLRPDAALATVRAAKALPEAPKLSIPLPADLANPSLSLAYPFVHTPAESIGMEKFMEKTVRDFPTYWAEVEEREGVNELRRQLGLASAKGPMQLDLPGLQARNGEIGLDWVSLTSPIWQAWKQRGLDRTREEQFRAKVDGLMAYAHDLGAAKGSAPAISIILARLDFMKRKASGKLPARPDRMVFTEPLRAWAVNPLFDSTRLGQPLLEICRLYEEMIN
ncbi:MAG: hypothetical protein ABIW76_00150 [Fibrobacteria bacterium]